MPAYSPAKGGPKPDFHSDDPRFDDGYNHYPRNPSKINPTDPPGSGGRVDVLASSAYPLPTPLESNKAWQEVNRQLNADVRFSQSSVADYPARLATVMAGNDLPDIMNLQLGFPQVPNLPDFLKARAADLTPYLSGAAARDYPNLANIPTYSWKNSLSAQSGHLYLIPVHRTPATGHLILKSNPIWDRMLGANFTPRNADDFKKALQQLNRPQAGQYAYAGWNSGNYGLPALAQMFGAPNGWKLESGRLVKDFETEEYKAALGYLRDLWDAGLIHPNTPTYSNQPIQGDMGAGRFVVSHAPIQQWNQYWRNGLLKDPPNPIGVLRPFPAHDGGSPGFFTYGGFNSVIALKQASPDRVRELLRIVNWLAAPFGSQEDLLLTYGLPEVDYQLDSSGDPVPTQNGRSNSYYVPWRYVGQPPVAAYQADLPGFAKAYWDVQAAGIPLAVDNPTLGHYAPSDYGKTLRAYQAVSDGTNDIILGRRPPSDFDQLVKDWAANGGNQARAEYTDAIAGAKQ